MYINELDYRNVGPINQLKIAFRRNANGVPVPTIFVGKNGSGKSILLSNIVDAFYEIATKEYRNATQSQGSGYQYYKAITPTQIQIGQDYMTAFIRLQQKDKEIEYIYKLGQLSFDSFQSTFSRIPENDLNWRDNLSYKNVLVKKEIVTTIFEENIVCFFGPNRYMKPVWMGEKYDQLENIGMYSLKPNYNLILRNPITAANSLELTLQWLCDVITDSRADLKKVGEEYNIEYPSLHNLNLLSVSRTNAEKVMSAILGETIIFRMGNRSAGGRRFQICKTNGQEIVPSLDSLSTGQLALFNLFATIIRYADNDNINLSHRISDIEGIVIIDEIELHLHTELQRKVLPKLISLFPKVQFIITSHAPMFLLGMREQFGEENFDIYEMPSGQKISVEQFSEFEYAYQYLTETNKYKEEIAHEIDKRKDRPLIITEGSSDWKHMKAAYNALLTDERCSDWLPNLEFEFLEYEPENSDLEGAIKLQMSASQLRAMCEQHQLVPQSRKLIFIADRDLPDITKKLNGTKQFKRWKNNVYSFCIPVPIHRKETPNICIEHLYLDNELKREIEFDDGLKRRIFMGNEFSKTGIIIDGREFTCTDTNSCGPEKIGIIDGSGKRKVYKIQDVEEKNCALTKMCFATYVLEKKEPFAHMDFSGFIPLFEIIRDILQQTEESV